MRIAIVHSFYSSSQPSGENQAVVDQANLLTDVGHDVRLFTSATDDSEHETAFRIRAAVRTLTTRGRSPAADIRAFAPDVVHVHNLFPNFGSAWIGSMDMPVVATLHNFRPLCANGLLFREGHVCTECQELGAWSAVRHGCYRGSRLATVPLAFRTWRGPQENPILQDADRLVCLSEPAARHYEAFGVPSERLRVLPNGIEPGTGGPRRPTNGRWVFVGRLSEEKGLGTLRDEWPSHLRLDLFGDGPMRTVLQTAGDSWTFHGSVDRTTVRNGLPEYEGLVFPSVCLEMQPTVVLEALSAGIPVVALRGNAGADIIQEFGGGVIYEGGQVGSALDEASRRREALGDEGVRVFQANFTPRVWTTRMSDLYEELLT